MTHVNINDDKNYNKGLQSRTSSGRDNAHIIKDDNNSNLQIIHEFTLEEFNSAMKHKKGQKRGATQL